ncbi:UNVERIFIED_CONTAM: hypothetical protein Cloal_2923 [Acetivibrio alkalicellulosi]
MPKLRVIKIGDKNLFNSYLKKNKYMSSEMNFTNLFMWRNQYNLKFFEINDMLCIIAHLEKESFAFTPIGKYSKDGFKNAINAIREYFHENRWEIVFKRVEESKLKYFEQYEKVVISDRDNSDYLYLSDRLISLKGEKYHSKRNHINNFIKLYNYEYVKFNEDYVEEALRINEEWCNKRNCETNKTLYGEKLANIEVLKNFMNLDCKGALIKVNGKFEAYTVGELISSDCAVIHIEKANSDIRGLYTFINQKFCENEWRNVSLINREQDLGIDGLRKAKMSYNPVDFVNKYDVWLK